MAFVRYSKFKIISKKTTIFDYGMKSHLYNKTRNLAIL
jgi:hypothetical protein